MTDLVADAVLEGANMAPDLLEDAVLFAHTTQPPHLQPLLLLFRLILPQPFLARSTRKKLLVVKLLISL